MIYFQDLTNTMITKDRSWMVFGAFAGILVSLKIWDNLDLFFLFLSILGTIVLSFLGYVAFRLRCSRPIRSVDFLPKSVLEMQRLLLDPKGLGDGLNAQEEKVAPKISRNIDQALNDILDLASKDYVFYWFGHLMMNSSISEEKLKKDLWHVICSLKERLANTDSVKILAIDLVKRVCNHFEKIRLIQENHPSSSKQAPNFQISPHLMSTEREIEYLGKVSEALIIFLFPASYGSCLPIRHILREVFARHLFYPAIDLITNPDSINIKILSWIQKNQSVKEMDKKTFIYADSFEEFVTMITTSNDIAEIKQMRYNILTEIMQATTMNNLRQAKGSIPHLPDEAVGGSKFKKSHLLSPQNMKRYINQLVHVKGVCEKRLNELGCDRLGREVQEFRENESLSFDRVMNSPLTRKYFYSYLEEEHHEELLGFWAAVEELRGADRTLWHQLGTEIFYGYINKPSSLVSVQRPLMKRIEAFLIGDDGPEVFFELQTSVMISLQETYFPAFLFSDQCYLMLEEIQEMEDFQGDPDKDRDSTEGRDNNLSLNKPEPIGQTISNYSGFAKSHLDHVSEKLQNKLQALTVSKLYFFSDAIGDMKGVVNFICFYCQALKSSLKPESKVLAMLQSEVDSLKIEHKEVKNHITRTESWAEHLGRWRCHVQAVEQNEDKETLQAYLIIHIPLKREDSELSALEFRGSEGASSSTAWSCVRKVSNYTFLS